MASVSRFPSMRNNTATRNYTPLPINAPRGEVIESNTTVQNHAKVENAQIEPEATSPPVVQPSTTPGPLPAPTLASRIPAKPHPSHRRDLGFVATVLLASACFGATAWFAKATFSNKTLAGKQDMLPARFKSFGDTLTILALLSGVLAFLTSAALDNVLEVLQWGLICRDQGVGVASVLAIAATTQSWGTLGMIFSRDPKVMARIWAAIKFLLRACIWLSRVALFLNTSVQTVYHSTFSYTAAAGIGPFESSYVDLYRDNLRIMNLNLTDDVLPYTTTAVAHGLIANPMHAVNSDHAGCDDESCDSYILPGGLSNSSPLPPTGLADDPVIVLDNVPSYQLDFQRDTNEPVFGDDCDLYWQHPYLIAIRFCVASSQVTEGSVHVSLQVCDAGTSGADCLSKFPISPSINTTFSLSALTTSLVVSRSNYSVLTLSQASTPIPDHSLDIESYRTALRWLLNYTASAIPGPSSVVEYFWASPEELQSNDWSVGSRQTLQSLLAYPLWFFNVNNAGNLAWGNNGTDLVLPEAFYTTAMVAKPFTKVVVNKAMFVLFVLLESMVLLSAWVAVLILWTSPVRLPKISSYPLIDFVTQTNISSSSQAGGNAGDAGVRAAMAGQRVKFRGKIDPAPSLTRWLRMRKRHARSGEKDSALLDSRAP